MAARASEFESLVDRQQLSRLRILTQDFAAQQLHGDVGDVVFLARIEYGDDVRMTEAPGSLRLAQEAVTYFADILELEFFRQVDRFDRDHTIDLRVAP